MIYDISPPLSERLAVWPGDVSLSRHVSLDMNEGFNITLSSMTATVHLGAHADAPSHYGVKAPTIDQVSLEKYLGRCQVVRANVPARGRVADSHVGVPIRAERLLIYTGTYPNPNHFNTDFAALCPEWIDLLHGQGVKLIGIDTPSVDLFESKDLPAHGKCLKHDMAILEGLVLKDVPEGYYELAALPLKLVGFDASPVRAVLRPY